jgi:hypothetical protein
MEDYILPHIEWEVLYEPITIPKVDDTKELPEGQKKIEINRDEQYKLRAVLSTKGDSMFLEQKIHAGVLGSFVEHFEITGSDQPDLHHYSLESCYLVGVREHWEKKESLCESDLLIQGLRIRPKTEREGEWLTEWYINGPRDSFVFRNSTMRKMLRTFILWNSLEEARKAIPAIILESRLVTLSS